jgi:hypothetical protein
MKRIKGGDATMPIVNMIILKRDGQPTTPMAQAQAESYLGNLLHKDRQANLKQALNQAFNGQGKPTGSYRHNAFPILHASSGNGQKSVTLFYYQNGITLTLVAMGEHQTSASYKVSVYGQPAGSFKEGQTIALM